jgi:hypothetical protein
MSSCDEIEQQLRELKRQNERQEEAYQRALALRADMIVQVEHRKCKGHNSAVGSQKALESSLERSIKQLQAKLAAERAMDVQRRTELQQSINAYINGEHIRSLQSFYDSKIADLQREYEHSQRLHRQVMRCKEEDALSPIGKWSERDRRVHRDYLPIAAIVIAKKDGSLMASISSVEEFAEAFLEAPVDRKSPLAALALGETLSRSVRTIAYLETVSAPPALNYLVRLRWAKRSTAPGL